VESRCAALGGVVGHRADPASDDASGNSHGARGELISPDGGGGGSFVGVTGPADGAARSAECGADTSGGAGHNTDDSPVTAGWEGESESIPPNGAAGVSVGTLNAGAGVADGPTGIGDEYTGPSAGVG
jgi:hypothetical protein